MAIVNIQYDTPGTITLNMGSPTPAVNQTVTNIGYASSTVDNSSTLYDDVFVQVTCTTSGTSSTGVLLVYAFASIDSGTSWTDGLTVFPTPTNAPVTLPSPQNVVFIGQINTPGTGTYVSRPMKIAPAFGGDMPQRWGIFVVNNTGNTLASGGVTAKYQGITYQVS